MKKLKIVEAVEKILLPQKKAEVPAPRATINYTLKHKRRTVTLMNKDIP